MPLRGPSGQIVGGSAPISLQIRLSWTGLRECCLKFDCLSGQAPSIVVRLLTDPEFTRWALLRNLRAVLPVSVAFDSQMASYCHWLDVSF
jgi:hypothetical protein